MISGQIYAMNSDTDIREIPDFVDAVNPAKTKMVWTEISLGRRDIFPIKTFDSFKTDSLSGVLNVMAKCTHNEGVWLQLVTAPREDTGWHHFILGWVKRFEKIRRIFRVKYWFKKNVTQDFDKKLTKKLAENYFVAIYD